MNAVRVETRPIRADDFDRLIKLRALADNAFRGDSPIEEIDSTRTRRYLEQPDAFGFVTEVEARAIGFILAMDGRANDGDGDVIPGLCHIAAVFVAPPFWNKRVASGLMHTLLAEARKRRFARAQLWTQDYNASADKLYLRFGFALNGRTKFDERGDPLRQYVVTL